MDIPIKKYKIPKDWRGEIRKAKAELRAQVGDVHKALDSIATFVKSEIEDIERCRAEGREVWPVLQYDSIAAGTVTEEERAYVKRRGCVVVRGTFPHDVATRWNEDFIHYVDGNEFMRKYKYAGDNFFATTETARPEIFPIYWSRPQMEARTSPRMAKVQSFLNHFWRYESEGRVWFNPDRDCLYPDRVRRRPPGTNSGGLAAHVDCGSLERWLLPEFRGIYRHLFNNRFDLYDPWDAAYRTIANEYESEKGSPRCSVFRTFQGWTALSDMERDQGVLYTVPIPAAAAYLMLRPLLDDVPADDLCGVAPKKVLAVDAKWSSLLLRAASVIPSVRAGDTVFWHCDMIHGVMPVKNQKGWGNVMYIPASPLCPKNAMYTRLVAQAFLAGNSPADFPPENYEHDWQNRFMRKDLNDMGRELLFPSSAKL